MLNSNLKWTRVYRIKRLSDGLFKTKGFGSHFTEQGYSWPTLASVRSHITQNKDCLKGCALMTYVLDQVAMEKI